MPKGVYERTRKVGYKVKENDCWEWQNAIRNGRYGGIRNDVTGKMMLAHRYYYEKKYGKVPDGLELDHLCRNSLCVNPNHLEAITHSENCQRGRLAKLTIEKVIEIKKMLKLGYTHLKISKIISISRSVIYDIMRKKIWKNIPDPETVE